ncbi:MAG: ribosome silencing factor [Legionellaceae bacterium]|nr:ribosome silencing factor [Legionellaceae bacterium]
MYEKNPRLSTLVKALEDIKATDIVVIDVSKQTTITDFMIICSGRASRHVKAIASHIMPIMKAAGLPTLHLSGLDSADWVLVDLGDFVVHIMQPECRTFYNLEGLWQDNTIQHDEISHK